MSTIEHQKKVIGRWLDGQQAAMEFSLFAMDRTDDLMADIDPEIRSFIRKIQEDLVADIVAHGDYGGGDDPLIQEFFKARRLVA